MLDAPDGPELARFYQRLLGWDVLQFDNDGYSASVAPSMDAGYNISCQTEKKYQPPVWPAEDGKPQMSMHLDIAVDELEESVAFAIEAGAELAEFQPQEDVRVMLDPAGHPFCLYLDVD
jgi:hypothetical protein